MSVLRKRAESEKNRLPEESQPRANARLLEAIEGMKVVEEFLVSGYIPYFLQHLK